MMKRKIPGSYPLHARGAGGNRVVLYEVDRPNEALWYEIRYIKNGKYQKVRKMKDISDALPVFMEITNELYDAFPELIPPKVALPILEKHRAYILETMPANVQEMMEKFTRYIPHHQGIYIIFKDQKGRPVDAEIDFWQWIDQMDKDEVNASVMKELQTDMTSKHFVMYVISGSFRRVCF